MKVKTSSSFEFWASNSIYFILTGIKRKDSLVTWSTYSLFISKYSYPSSSRKSSGEENLSSSSNSHRFCFIWNAWHLRLSRKHFTWQSCIGQRMIFKAVSFYTTIFHSHFTITTRAQFASSLTVCSRCQTGDIKLKIKIWKESTSLAP